VPLLLRAMGHLERAHLARARRRLARLDLYPAPVRMRHVRIVHAPCLFRLPGLRRFAGYEVGPLILVARPREEVANDLVTHELCHVWQDQHRRVYMWLSYLWQGYRHNEHEIEARMAAARTRDVR
jgi:hypothetical protein